MTRERTALAVSAPINAQHGCVVSQVGSTVGALGGWLLSWGLIDAKPYGSCCSLVSDSSAGLSGADGLRGS